MFKRKKGRDKCSSSSSSSSLSSFLFFFTSTFLFSFSFSSLSSSSLLSHLILPVSLPLFNAIISPTPPPLLSLLSSLPLPTLSSSHETSSSNHPSPPSSCSSFSHGAPRLSEELGEAVGDEEGGVDEAVHTVGDTSLSPCVQPAARSPDADLPTHLVHLVDHGLHLSLLLLHH